jgi:hypothetical protein
MAATLHLPLFKNDCDVDIFCLHCFSHHEVLANKSVVDTMKDTEPIMKKTINAFKTINLIYCMTPMTKDIMYFLIII